MRHLDENDANENWLRSSVRTVIKGGPGSGNFAHIGRPGMVGGSSSEGDEAGFGRKYQGHLKEALMDWKGMTTDMHSRAADLINGDVHKDGTNLTYRDSVEQARALLNAVIDAPPDSQKLYRGMSIADTDTARAMLQVGKEIQVPLMGLSESRSEADYFARRTTLGMPGKVQLLVTLEKGSRSVRVSDHIYSGYEEDEKEHITGGRFVVTGYKEVGTSAGTKQIQVSIRQVEPPKMHMGITIIKIGTASSGFHGHSGRVGEVGGSAPSGGGKVGDVIDNILVGKHLTVNHDSTSGRFTGKNADLLREQADTGHQYGGV